MSNRSGMILVPFGDGMNPTNFSRGSVSIECHFCGSIRDSDSVQFRIFARIAQLDVFFATNEKVVCSNHATGIMIDRTAR